MLCCNFFNAVTCGFPGPQETFIAAERMQVQISSAVVEIKWFDDELELPIFVGTTDDALIGVEMLIDTILEIDYINSTVKITKPN